MTKYQPLDPNTCKIYEYSNPKRCLSSIYKISANKIYSKINQNHTSIVDCCYCDTKFCLRQCICLLFSARINVSVSWANSLVKTARCIRLKMWSFWQGHMLEDDLELAYRIGVHLLWQNKSRVTHLPSIKY